MRDAILVNVVSSSDTVERLAKALVPEVMVDLVDGDNDLSPSASLVEIPDGVRDLAQRIRSVDDRDDFAGVDEVRQEPQILRLRRGDDHAQPLAHERGHHERAERPTHGSDPPIAPFATPILHVPPPVTARPWTRPVSGWLRGRDHAVDG